MTTDKTETALIGASHLTDVLCQLHKQRAFLVEVAKEDMVYEDGTVAIAGASHLPMIAQIDKAIELFSQRLNLQADA